MTQVKQSGGLVDEVDDSRVHYEIVYREGEEPYMDLKGPVRVSLADLRRHIHTPYDVGVPEGGLRPLGTFTEAEIRALYPFALVLACLDGNAFVNIDVPENDLVRQYVPDAHEALKSNGVLEFALKYTSRSSVE